MMMGDIGRTRAAAGAEQFQLETLERFPCGCVAAIQSVRPSGVTVVSLEAKGPHCPFRSHRANKVIRLGEELDSIGYDDAEEFTI
jgi:hypothetical protein